MHKRKMQVFGLCCNSEFGPPVRQWENIVSFLSAEQKIEVYRLLHSVSTSLKTERKEKAQWEWKRCDTFQHLVVFSISQTRPVSRKDGCANKLWKSVPAGGEFTHYPRGILPACRRSLFSFDLRPLKEKSNYGKSGSDRERNIRGGGKNCYCCWHVYQGFKWHLSVIFPYFAVCDKL